MRMTTKTVLAARNVGLAGESIKIWTGPTAQVLKEFLTWVSENSMAKRFDFSMGRTEEEVVAALNRKADTKFLGDSTMSEIDQMLADMLVKAGEDESEKEDV